MTGQRMNSDDQKLLLHSDGEQLDREGLPCGWMVGAGGRDCNPGMYYDTLTYQFAFPIPLLEDFQCFPLHWLGVVVVG